MNEKKFLKTESVLPLIEKIAAAHRVLVPVREGKAVVYRPYRKNRRIDLGGAPTLSPKEATFPKSETLMAFRTVRDEKDSQKAVVTLKETLPEGTCVVFGGRPCGARGKRIFDRVFDTEGVADPYYTRRRDATLFVTIACAEPESTCFCHSVGGGPADPTGSDVMLTPVTGGYVAEAVTEAGEALLFPELFEDAGDRATEAAAVQETAKAKLGEPADYTGAREKLLALFDNKEFWEEMSAKCIACGACTYLCPTCYCFNITDEAAGGYGKRVRSWDTCMQATFTLEASGHNPRAIKANRLKNRVGHKFSYYPGLHGGVIACCGCGRCIKSCPSAVDIRHIVKSAQEYEDADSESVPS